MDTGRDGFEIDLHRLDLCLADTRQVEPRAVERLVLSIARVGQRVPCVTVAGQGEQLILVDGYRRQAACRKLGRDTLWVETWTCDLAEALIRVLGRAQGRLLTAVEEGLMVRELIQGQGLSQHAVANRTGHDVSWVCRRLQLVATLSDELLAAVCAGSLSSWAATRVVAPLARANSEHARQLLAAGLSTREMSRWFEHYQRALHPARSQMAERPRMFLDALRAREELRADTHLRDGPEGQCASDLRILTAVAQRLCQRLRKLGADVLAGADVARLCSVLSTLQSELARHADDHTADPQHHPDLEGARPQPAPHQPVVEALAQHRAALPGQGT